MGRQAESQKLFGKHGFHVNKAFLQCIKMNPLLKKVSQHEGQQVEPGEWFAKQLMKEWQKVSRLGVNSPKKDDPTFQP